MPAKNEMLATVFDYAHPAIPKIPARIEQAPNLRPAEAFAPFVQAMSPLTKQFNRGLTIGNARAPNILQMWVTEYGPKNGRGYEALNALGFSFRYDAREEWYVRSKQHGTMPEAELRPYQLNLDDMKAHAWYLLMKSLPAGGAKRLRNAAPVFMKDKTARDLVLPPNYRRIL